MRRKLASDREALVSSFREEESPNSEIIQLEKTIELLVMMYDYTMKPQGLKGNAKENGIA